MSGVVRSTAVDRDAFFAQLDALTEKEIEARLPLFDSERLSLVQEYMAVDQIRTALQGGFEATQTTKTAAAAFKAAASANTKATVALIFALGGAGGDSGGHRLFHQRPESRFISNFQKGPIEVAVG